MQAIQHSIPLPLYSLNDPQCQLSAVPRPVSQPQQGSMSAWQKVKIWRSHEWPILRELIQKPATPELILRAMGSAQYSLLKPVILQAMGKLSDDQLRALFKALLDKCMRDNQPQLIERCLELVRLDQLQSCFRDKIGARSAVEMARELPTCIETPIREGMKAPPVGVKRILSQFFVSLMDTVVTAFGFFDFGHPPESRWEASIYLNVYYRIVLIPITVYIALQTALGVMAALAITVGFTVAAAAFLYSYVNYWQPCPEKLPFCINLVERARQGQLPPVFGRHEEVEQLIEYLRINMLGKGSGVVCHALHCGPSRSGKTEIVHALAHRIASGNVPDFLRNMKLQEVNIAQLAITLQSDFGDRTELLLKPISRHADEITLYANEIHAAFLGNKKLANKLKMHLDPTSPTIRNFIAATTEKEFNELMKPDEAFCSRFSPISVKQITPENGLAAFEDTADRIAERIAPALKVSADVYEKIAKEKADTPQYIEQGKLRLTQAIGRAAVQHVRNLDDRPAEERLAFLRRIRSASQRALYATAGALRSQERSIALAKQLFFYHYVLRDPLNDAINDELARIQNPVVVNII